MDSDQAGSPGASGAAKELSRSVAKTAPLSFAQQRFWFLEQLVDGAHVHGIPILIRLAGPFDSGALQRSMCRLFRRHEILRTRIAVKDGEPVQEIEVDAWFVPQEMDCRSPLDGKKRAGTWLASELARPFDLSRLPLIRASVLKLTEEDCVLVLIAHHMIVDAWSIGILRRELTSLYEGERAGKRVELPTLAVQYADYAIFQRESMKGGEYGRQLSYWVAQLTGAEPLILPTDRPRQRLQMFHGSVVPFELNDGIADALRQLEQNHAVTLSMILLAAFAVLLASYSGQDEITVGTPIANRNRTEFEGLIGPCLNIVAIRTSVRMHRSFQELLKDIREICLQAYSNQEVPFEHVVEALHLDRDASMQPLFQVMFAFQQDATGNAGIQDARPLTVKKSSSKFDLTLQLTNSGKRVRGFVEFSTDLFDEWRVRQMIRHFICIVEAATANPSGCVGEVPFVRHDEQQKIIGQWNEMAGAMASSIVTDLFEEQVIRTPTATALVYDGQVLTYSALNERANRLAHWLMCRGLGPEDVVAIATGRTPETLVSVLAILKAGAAYVLLDCEESSREHLTFILTAVNATCILAVSGLARALVPDLTSFTVDSAEMMSELEKSSGANPADAARSVRLLPNHLACITFTAGVSETPRAVAVTHDSLRSALLATEKVPPLNQPSKTVVLSSLHAASASIEILRSLVSGTTIYLQSSHDGLYPAGNGEADGATLVYLTARQALTLVDTVTQPLNDMTFVIGGGSLSAKTRHRLQDLGARVVTTYGTAETMPWNTYVATTQSDPNTTIGKPCTGVRAYVLDRCLRPVPIGVTGELYIAGPSLARGYFRGPRQTSERFVPDLYGSAGSRMVRTGDLVRWTSDGELEFLGLKRDAALCRGGPHLFAIETALYSCAGVREALAVSCSDENGKYHPGAYVIGDPLLCPDATSVRRELSQVLPPSLVPKIIHLLPGLPLTPTGAVDRRRLPYPTTASLQTPDSEAPLSETEQILARLWKELLAWNGPEIGTRDDFFDLGGHSLLAAQMITKISETFDVHISVNEFFNGPTIANVACLIEERLVDEIDRLTEKETLQLIGREEALLE